MASVRYVPDEGGTRAIAVGPELQAACLAVAEEGKGYAETLAQQFRDTGEYAESFHVAPMSLVIGRLPRAGARLENTSDHAAAVEWGNANVPNPHRVLGRTHDYLERRR